MCHGSMIRIHVVLVFISRGMRHQYYVKKVLHTCKMLMIETMELRTLEGQSDKKKQNKRKERKGE
jgi:hypothetical protein